MEIIMLGTSCMMPTKERNVQSIYLDYNGEGILIDCGEGTQRQMNIMGLNRNKVKKILISHWHGDHVGGLIGLLQTISNSDNPDKVMIFGPKDTKDRLAHLLRSVSFESEKLDVEVKELHLRGVETVYENEDYFIQAAYLDHRVPCVGYSFVEKDKRRIMMAKAKKLGLHEGPLIGKLQRGEAVTFKGETVTPDEVSHVQKGKKVSFILDTLPCSNAIALAKDADLLVAESAYASDLEEKGLEYKHLTTKQAALIATSADVKKLVITHFSQRYKTSKELAEEIKTFFPESEAAFDFMRIKL